MEAMGILGFIFGLAALNFATTAKKEIANLKLELEEIKASLDTSAKPDENTTSD